MGYIGYSIEYEATVILKEDPDKTMEELRGDVVRTIEFNDYKLISSLNLGIHEISKLDDAFKVVQELFYRNGVKGRNDEITMNWVKIIEEN